VSPPARINVLRPYIAGIRCSTVNAAIRAREAKLRGLGSTSSTSGRQRGGAPDGIRSPRGAFPMVQWQNRV
jgi:hypothetical protein